MNAAHALTYLPPKQEGHTDVSWARYDDTLPINRKIRQLLAMHGERGAAALGLHVLCNTWSRHEGTRGFIPSWIPADQLGKPGDRLAQLLVDVGMFDPVEGGWTIHNFDHYSDPNDDGRSAAERRADLSRVRAEAGRRGGIAKAQARQASGNTPSNVVALPQQTSGPVPVPENPPNPPPSGGNHDGSHDNCRACGTNRRGPKPAPEPTPIPVYDPDAPMCDHGATVGRCPLCRIATGTDA